MFSKALFKQSVKANFMRWLTITFSTSLMLMIVIIVLGCINISGIRDSLKSVFTTANEESTLKENAIDSYEIYLTSVDAEHALVGLSNGNQTLGDKEEDFKMLWDTVVGQYEIAIDDFKEENQKDPTEEEKQQIRQTLAPQIIEYMSQNQVDTSSLGFDQQSMANMLVCLMKAYDGNHLKYVDSDSQQEFFTNASPILKQAYFDYISSVAYSKAMEREDATEELALALGSAASQMAQVAMASYQGDGDNATYNRGHYQEPAKQYTNGLLYQMGQMIAPEDYTEDQIKQFQVSLKVISNSSIETYQIWLEEGATKEDAKNEATKSVSDQIPEGVANALTELGSMDISGLLVGSMFFKMAGLLLPIVFVITTANGLLAGQVDSGSMAYVLSTPTRRRTVTITQMIYLLSSIFVMFAVLTVSSVVTMLCVGADFGISITELLLLNLGAFVTTVAIGGFCFMCSAIFNRSKHSISIGGGLSIFFLVCTILGLFGSNVMPQAMRISAMNVFNYVSIISLFDTSSILAGGTTFIWKLAILLVFSAVCFFIGIKRFDKKDLPL